MNDPASRTFESQHDTVVIGGGQAGLAIGYYLSRQRRDFVLLDASARVGDAWRARWDSLRLFTPAKYDGLPGLPFPGDRLAFPTKDEQADYLEAYSKEFALPILSGIHVDSLHRERDQFVATAAGAQFRAARVVVATGGYRVPVIPDFAKAIDPSVRQWHSSTYLHPGELQPGNVLVVGMGNSGAEIALDVSRSHPTWVSGTPSAELPFRLGGRSGRIALPVVRVVGMHVLTRGNPIGRAAIPRLEAHAVPLIRTKRRDLIAAGVRQVGRVIGVEDGRPITDGGDGPLDVSNIIWCTGFREDFRWIDLPVFGDGGQVLHHRGVVESLPGLYFLGQGFLYAEASATLPGVGRDARYLARRIAQAAATGAAAPEDRSESAPSRPR